MINRNALKWTAGAALAAGLVGASLRMVSRHRQEKADEAFGRYLQAQIEQQKTASFDAIARFHQQFNEQKFDEIAASAGRHRPQDRQRWLESMRNLRGGLGAFQSVKSSQITCYSEPPGLCAASYVCEYEGGEATEHFALEFRENLLIQLTSVDLKSPHLPYSSVDFRFD